MNRAIGDVWSVANCHQPSDIWRPDYHAEWAAKEASFDFLMSLSVAMSDERPRWNPDDVFATVKRE